MNRICFAILLALPLAHAQQPRLKALILTGESDTLYHDWRASTPFVREVLEHTGRFDVKVVEQAPGITAGTLQPFDVLVLNYLGPRWGPQSEKAVEEAVRSGRGLISFHGVTYGPFYGMQFDAAAQRWNAGPAGDRGWEAYPALIGARWQPANIGHGRRHVFPVKWVNREHPISAGLEPTFLANDELYHRLDLLPGTTVLATAFSDPATGGTGKDEPIVWTAAFGKGRTVHLTLGHDLSAMSQPGFETTFARGAEWAATGRVAPVQAAEKKPVRVRVVTGGHTYPASFYTLFEGVPDFEWTHATNPREAFPEDLAQRCDVLVLHDMWEDLDAALRERLRAFVESGKGVVSIHHAIVDYTAWPWWWQEVIGGKYFTKEEPGHPASSYKEGIQVIANPTKAGMAHPVTRGVGPIVLEDDEMYRGMWHAPGIQVLMEVDNPLNDQPVVYTGPHYRAIYIQLGHGEKTMYYPGYRKLVRNAVRWAAGRLQ